MKKNLLLLFFILAGVVVGGLVATACQNVGFLSWLSYTANIGFNPKTPFVLDLAVLKFSLGFAMSISVAQVITIGLAIFLYSKTKVK